MNRNILIYTSHAESAERAYAALTEHGISVVVATSEQDALSVVFSYTPAFLWIDLDINAARSFLSKIVRSFLHPPPYIVLTSSFSDSTDRADMLDHGADACVESPVDLREISAILNAVLRREERLQHTNTASEPSYIKYKHLLIDPTHHKVMMRNQPVKLTPKEYDILCLLAAKPGMVFTKEQIYSRIWKEEPLVGIDVVFNHISSLRKKLGQGHRDKEYIQTVHKVGYRFAGLE